MSSRSARRRRHPLEQGTTANPAAARPPLSLEEFCKTLGVDLPSRLSRIFSTPWSPKPAVDPYAYRLGYYGNLSASPSYVGKVELPEPRIPTSRELLEACDLTTPGERLAALFAGNWVGDAMALHLAHNPSLPFPQLTTLLEDTGVAALDAWHNPSVPLLLMSAPSDDLEDAAARVLWRQTGRVAPDVTLDSLGPMSMPPLEQLVGMLGRIDRDHPWMWEAPDGVPQLLALARHLAGLFGLPWPEPGTRSP